MKTRSRSHYEVRAKVAKALAHPSRLLILDVLAGGEACVCKLTPLVGADQSTVSKHLAILKNAGLIGDRKEGLNTYYSLKVCCLEGFWKCVESVLKHNLKEQAAALGS